MASTESRYATMAVQALLRAQGADIVIDGAFGPRSQTALEAYGTPTIRQVKAEYGIADAQPAVQPSDRVFVPQAELDAAVAAASKRFPGTEAFLRLMITLENYPAPGGVYTSYAGTFKGVPQFSSSTWNLGIKQFPEVGGYENVRDVNKAVLLAAWYAADHERAYSRYKRRTGAPGEYSPEIAYLYHQQGQPDAETYLRTGRVVNPKQSSKSLAVLRSARELALGVWTA